MRATEWAHLHMVSTAKGQLPGLSVFGVVAEHVEEGFADFWYGVGEGAWECAAGGQPVSATGEFFGECSDVVRIATTQAEFNLAGWQFHSDEGGFRVGDSEALIDEALGIGGDGTGFGQIPGIHLQPDQSTIGVRDRA